MRQCIHEACENDRQPNKNICCADCEYRNNCDDLCDDYFADIDGCEFLIDKQKESEEENQ